MNLTAAPSATPLEPGFYRPLIESGLAFLAKASALDSILREVVNLSLDLCQADAASLSVIRERELEFMVSRNLSLEARGELLPLEKSRLPLDNSTISGFVAGSGQTLFIDDVNHLPADSPYQFDRSFDRRLHYRSQSMLVLPLTHSAGTVVGVLQMINHRHAGGFDAFPGRLLEPLNILARQAGMALGHALLSDELRLAQRETVYRLGLAAEARDQETGAHLHRVSHLARGLARGSRQDRAFADLILEAAPLHDVGKIAMPDAILQKPGPLTPEERLVMREHTSRGYELLAGSRSPVLKLGASIALTHHEKWDGTGYPRQLQGEAIPIEGRLVAVADVFDALSTPRRYKEAWPRDRVLDFLRRESGHHFDPGLVAVFFASGFELELEPKPGAIRA